MQHTELQVQNRQIERAINSFVGFKIVKISEDHENGGCQVDFSYEVDGLDYNQICHDLFTQRFSRLASVL